MSIYIVARSHGLSTRLLPREVIEALSNAQTLNDMVSLLSPTDYGAKLEKGEEVKPYTLYRAITEVFRDRINFLASVPEKKNIRDFVVTYLRRYEVEDIVKALRHLKAGELPEEILGKIINFKFAKVNFDEMTQSRSVDKAIELLKNYGYMISDAAIELYKKYDSLLPIEAALMKNYYRRIFDTLKNLSRKDRKQIEMILRIEADIENMFIAVSSFLYNYAPELVEYLLIPYTEKISLDSFKRVVYLKTAREILETFKPYETIAENILRREELIAKVEANKYIYKLLEQVKVAYMMSMPYLVYFIKRCEFEWRDLTYLSYAIHYCTEKECVRRGLISI